MRKKTNDEKGFKTMKSNTRPFLPFIWMTIGSTCVAAGVYFFIMPNGFATGGVSGISNILGYLLPFLTPASVLLTLNILLLILGFFILGKETSGKTAYCSLLYSFETWVFEKLIPMSAPLTDQMLLELIYAISFTSVGAAILFHTSASSGGTDIIALILKKYTSLNVGKALLFTDLLIALSSFVVFGIRTGLYSVLGLFAKAFLVDSVIESINSCKYFTIITEHPEEITQYIMTTMKRGVTSHPAMGEYTHQPKTMLHTLCRRFQATELKKTVKRIDTSEILGRGFRKSL
jgi:uncharacterized membrane-anchored protein YitT (DUF2179 family)